MREGNKIYLLKNVYEAAQERLHKVFDEFENIVVSISGGKDSTALLHLALQVARERGRKVNAFYLDQEAEYASTLDIIEKTMCLDGVIPWWYQVPIKMTNATSFQNHFLYAWGEGEKWMRDKHPLAIQTLEEEYPQRFYDFIEWFEQRWEKGKTCFLVGLRAEESINRFRAVVRNPGYKDWTWTTCTKDIVKAYPIYDWTFEDIWHYICIQEIPYNRLYDNLYRRGLNIKELRVSNLIHEKSFKCLPYLQEFEPDTYDKLIARLPGVHVAARYAHEKTMYDSKELPKHFKSWKEYRDHLVTTIPAEHTQRFLKRFDVQGQDEYTYRQQCKQLLLNDWENNIAVKKKPDRKDTFQKWRDLL